MESFDAAIAEHSISRLAATYASLATLAKETPAEHSRELGPQLAAQLSEMPRWHAAVYSGFVGALVERNADAVACARPLRAGLRAGMEQALEFARLREEHYGEEEADPGSGRA
ncbi:hypothetical protein ACFQ7B_04630 [Streptomyces erythrochromogenes]|uniref:hypothetical protein n=1 Tax=Streptomyces erythrochromogenes TaxID=285574 RepID=UPI0036D0F5B4